ncbi:MAG: UPF0175 family protein [Spirochaetales bacterium]|nr:UPF0175 family protein [Spirochaetales bacterium]
MNNAVFEVPVSQQVKQFLMAAKSIDSVLIDALILYPYIANRTISHGRAAELLGITKNKLIEMYASIGIPYFDMDEEEFRHDLKVFDELVGVMA